MEEEPGEGGLLLGVLACSPPVACLLPAGMLCARPGLFLYLKLIVQAFAVFPFPPLFRTKAAS